MKRGTKLYILAAFTALAMGCGAWYVFTNWKSEPNTATSVSKPATVSDPKKHGYPEVALAREMIIYNQQAIDLANIAQHGGGEPAVKDFADTSMRVRSQAADHYAAWLREWNESYLTLSDYPREDGHDGYPTSSGMPKVSELTKIVDMALADRDKEFLRLTLQLYEGAITQLDLLKKDIQYGEMKAYVESDIDRYAQDIQVIKNLKS